jgi:hypothetical protein
MKPSEFIKEEFDSPEYNDEAGMVKTNLQTIKRMCDTLDEKLADDENLAEWAQEKIAVVSNMLVTVTDYIVSQHEQGIQPTVSEDASAGASSSGAVATSMGGGAGFGKSIFMSRKGPVKTKKTK